MAKGLVTSYGFAEPFEDSLITLLCRDAILFERIGQYIEPVLMTQDVAKAVIKAAKILDPINGPGNEAAIIQQLRTLARAGKASPKAARQYCELIARAEAAGLPDTEHVVTLAKSPIAQRLNERAAYCVSDQVTNSEADWAKAKELMRQSSAVGKVSVNSALPGRMTAEERAAITEQLANPERVETVNTSIEWIDHVLGGIPRATFTVAIGATGTGKSLMMSQLGAAAAAQGKSVAYASFEMGRNDIDLRIRAAMSGYQTGELEGNSRRLADAEEVISERYGFPDLSIHAFSAGTDGSTVDDIVRWVCKLEETGTKIDILIVDPLDRVSAGDKSIKNHTYDHGEAIAEKLSTLAHARNMWVWASTQSQGRKETAGGRLGSTRKSKDAYITNLGDIGESIHKARIADIVFTISAVPIDDDPDANNDIVIRVPKVRKGKSGFISGKLTADASRGRLVVPDPNILPVGAAISYSRWEEG